MKIINRQISSEILTLFLIILLISSVPMIIQRLFRMMDLVVNRGLPASKFLKMLVLLFPFIFYLIIPFAFLFAATLCFSRMYQDNEITALKAAGIGLHQLLPSVIAISIFISLSAMFLSLYLVPLSSASFRNEVIYILRSGIGAGITEKVFNDDFPGITIYVNQVSGNSRFNDVFIYDRRDPERGYIIVAKRGEFRYDSTRNTVELILYEGSLHQMERAVDTYHNAIFKTYQITVDLEGLMGEKFIKRRRMEMFPIELIDMIKKTTIKGQNPKPYIIALCSKISYPLSCIAFAIIAIPLGAQAGRIGKYSGFIAGIVVSIIYYLLYTGFNGAAEAGMFSPYLASFMPTILLTIFGIYIFLKVSAESVFYPIYLTELIIFYIKKRVASLMGAGEDEV